ncbi:MAG: CotH kinase family protein [Myxococcales bacterium]|nr:CotH kinase family protein [Myxococcales bacterium]
MVRLVAMVVVALAACADVPKLPDVCAGDQPPLAPTVLTDVGGRIDVTAATFVVDATAPIDPDGDLLAVTDYEVWTANADGSPRERVWSVALASSHPPPVTLAMGAYEGPAAVLGSLELWRDHLVRIRQTTRTVDGCTQAGPWSSPVAFRTDDGSTALFDDTTVRDVELTLSAESYAAINAQAEPPGCVPYSRDYFAGDVAYAGVALTGVGVKVKGGCGSARELDEKAGFKVSLDWDDPTVAGCPADRRIGGLGALTLNNMVQDKSLTHERLAYALFRAMGVPAARTAPVRVLVNGALFGHYLHVESVDRRFLARHFGSNQGMLYEGTYWCQLESGNIADDDSGCLTREFTPDACDGAPGADADPETYEPVRGLIARLDALPIGGFYPAVTQILDFDRYLTMWAVEAMLSHWDGYSYDIVNNYRVYHDPARDRWTIIPSGLDQTFQPNSIDEWGPMGRIAQRCLSEPACEAAFAARLRDALAAFEDLQLEARRAAIVAQLTPLLAADPGREFDPTEFAQAQAETAQFIADRPAQVRAVLAAHGF